MPSHSGRLPPDCALPPPPFLADVTLLVLLSVMFHPSPFILPPPSPTRPSLSLWGLLQPPSIQLWGRRPRHWPDAEILLEAPVRSPLRPRRPSSMQLCGIRRPGPTSPVSLAAVQLMPSSHQCRPPFSSSSCQIQSNTLIQPLLGKECGGGDEEPARARDAGASFCLAEAASTMRGVLSFGSSAHLFIHSPLP